MKKKQLLLVTITCVIVSSIFWYSCQEDPVPNEKVEVVFNIHPKTNTALKSMQLNDLNDADKIIITIQESDGSSTDYTQHEMNVFVIGSSYITSKISLLVGDYHVTEFYVIDDMDSIIFAAPMEGSLLAQNVNDPLPILFTVTENGIHSIDVEVVSTESLEAEDFGLVSFNIIDAETFQFLISVSELGTSQLLASDLAISAAGYTYAQQLAATTSNIVTIRDGFDNYLVTVSKDGYTTFTDSISNAVLKSYNSLPLLVELESTEMPACIGVWVQDMVEMVQDSLTYFLWDTLKITQTRFINRAYVLVDTIDEYRIWEGFEGDLVFSEDTLTVTITGAGRTRFDDELLVWNPTEWYNEGDPGFETFIEDRFETIIDGELLGVYEVIGDSLHLFGLNDSSEMHFRRFE